MHSSKKYIRMTDVKILRQANLRVLNENPVLLSDLSNTRR